MQLEKVKVDDELDNMRCSYGLAPILNTLVDSISGRLKPKWNLFLVNIETIIRNCQATDRSEFGEIIVDRAIADCKLLAQYLIEVLKDCNQDKRVRPIICFYSASYENVGKTYIKEELPAGTVERWNIKALFEQRWPYAWDIKSDDVDILFSVQDKKTTFWISKSLINDVNSFTTKTLCQYRNCIMISHMPVDYHVMRRVGEFSLLESYTGALKRPSDLSTKLFNNPWVPFNKYTHVLFGDKYLLKPLAVPKVRKELKKNAETEQWKRLPDTAVLGAIARMSFIPTEILTAPQV